MRIRIKRNNLFTRLAALLLAAMAFTGCAVLRQEYDSPIPVEDQFLDGESHYRDVLHELGPPVKLSTVEDGMVFLYERAALTERQFGIDIDYKDVPILKIIYGRGNVEGETAMLLFDNRGILRSHDFESWTRDLGGGMAVQLFISVMSVTSKGGYDKPPVSNYWGANLLESSLPRALNRRSNLYTGQSGVERKGSPNGAGQHTLELLPTSKRN
jgi:hypothetical protein